MGELEIKSSNTIGNSVPISRNLIPTDSKTTKDMLLTGLGNNFTSLLSDNFSISNSNNKSNTSTTSTSCTRKCTETKQTTVKNRVVWDCSMCRLSNKRLKDLFFCSNVENIFTSATFNELIKLSQNQNADTYEQNNAKTVINLILNNKCTCVEFENTSFSVDQELINYCLEHKCTLYSTDYVMCLIAKMFGVKYNYFNQIHLTLNYTCQSETSYILLTESILQNCIKPEQILKFAQTDLSSGKFIITDKFIYQLESRKAYNTTLDSNIRAWIDFFVADYDDNYSSIIDLSETNLSIIDISKAFDATIICSDIKDCFLYKASNCKFKYIDAKSFASTSTKNDFNNSTATTVVNSANVLSNSTFQNNGGNVASATSIKSAISIAPTQATQYTTSTTSTKTNATQSTTSITSTKTNATNVSKETSTGKKLVSVPHLNFNKAVLSLRKLSLSESMWVLDEQLNDCKNSYKNSIKLEKNMHVVHIIRKFDKYVLTVYKLVNPHHPLSSFIEYSTEFSKKKVKNVDIAYRSYAINATLML